MNARLTTTLLAALGVAGMDVALADLKSIPPKNVDLTGLWKLNPELSDDPQKAVETKRSDSAGSGTMRRRGSGGPGGIVIGNGKVGGTISMPDWPGTGGGGASTKGGTSDRPDDDPEPSTMKMPLDSFLATREEFEIQQTPQEVKINTLEDSQTCKAAVPSKAPVPGGDMATQRCGWDGSAWVVELQIPGDELKRITRYQLRKKGTQLAMVTAIKGGKTPLSGLEIERVYDRIVTP